MNIKYYIMNVLRGLHVWAHCKIAEMFVAFSAYGFYLAAKGVGYGSIIIFIAALWLLYCGIRTFASNGIEFFPKKCKCGEKCQKKE